MPRRLRSVLRTSLDRLVDDELGARHARIDLHLNEYGYDRWGASRDDQLRLLALARFLHRSYFRVHAEVKGRLGFPEIPSGAIEYLKYPCTVDGTRFREATGFAPARGLIETVRSVPHPPAR